MAHDRPWYKRNGADFVMGAMALPDNDHRYAYSAIVDMLNDHGRRLPDDAAFVCGFTGLTRKKWSIVRANLLEAGKLIMVDGRLSNPRFEREFMEAEQERQARIADGREGGRKSAALRAAAKQGQLDLSAEDHPDYRANNPPHKRPDSAPDSGANHSGTPQAKPRKSAENVQAPPQAPRARASASESRDQILHPTDHPSLTASADPDGRTDGPSPPPDLLALTRLCCDAGGLGARIAARPALLSQSMDIVRGWITAGVDITGTAVPAIKAKFLDMTEPAHSLAKFSAAVDTRHAKAAQYVERVGKPLPPPALPVYQFDGESPDVERFRRALAKRITERSYAPWCANVRFRRRDRMPGDNDLLQIGPAPEKVTGAWSAADAFQSHRAAMESVALAVLGVHHVFETAERFNDGKAS